MDGFARLGKEFPSKAARLVAAALLLIAFAAGAATAFPAAAKAAPAGGAVPIERIAENEYTPFGYNWGMNFTSIEVESGFEAVAGEFCKYYHDAYQNTALVHDGDDGFMARIDGTTEGMKGSYKLRYTGGEYKGTAIDAIVTLSDWDYAPPAAGWDGFWERPYYGLWETGVFVNPSYLAREAGPHPNLNFYTRGLASLDIDVEFVVAGTTKHFDVAGHSTCVDLDTGQNFGFGGAVDLAQVLDYNDYLGIDAANSLVTSPWELKAGVSADPFSEAEGERPYEYGLVGIYFDTASKAPARMHFDATWRGAGGTCQSFFAMTDEYLTAPNPNGTDDPDGYLPVVKGADKESGVSVGDEVAYTVDVQVHERGVNCRSNYCYSSFEIVDVLPPEMRYVEGTGRLLDESGNEITGAGSVAYEGLGNAGATENTVKFEFSPSYLENTMPMRGEHYTFAFSAVLTEYPADGSLSVTNSSYARVNGNDHPSNDVVTKLIPPEWSVDKVANSYEYEVGDTVTYTATFTQIAKNAQCRESIVSDNLPEGLELIPESVKASGIKDLPEPETNGNRWSIYLDKFNYGDVLTVTYRARALQSGNGAEHVNLASAHANNAMDTNDPAEVWINTAKLSIEKNADYYEHYVGASDQDPGTVVYTVVVENTKAGTVANDVVITDDSLPEGLVLGRNNDGSLKVSVEGVPETVAYPVAGSDDVHNETEERDVVCKTTAQGIGFTTSINHLAAGVPVTITYTCYPDATVAGWEIVNHANADATNALPEADDAKIWINQPTLLVDKEASMDEYEVGDLVTYHIHVTNTTPGTLGRNLVVSDLIGTEGVELQRDSIMVWDSEGNDITSSCTVHYNRNEPAFLVETHRNIVSDAHEYTQFDEDESTLPGDNPLGIGGETEIWVDYTVAITDADLAGKTVENTALAATDEPNTETTDDELIYVKGAKLVVSKSSDKQVYEVGEVATYTVVATNSREAAPAVNVTMGDALQESGFASIAEGSVEIVDDAGNPIDAPINYTYADDGSIVGWSCVTGVTLSDDESLTATYQVEMLKKHEGLYNVASAAAENAVGGNDDNDVDIVAPGEGPGPDAEIEKLADRTQAHVGDIVTYTIAARILNDSARDVCIADSGLPEGCTLDAGSIKIDVNGQPVEATVDIDGNGFVAHVGDLSAGDVVTISYESMMEDPKLIGSTLENVATLTSIDIEGAREAQAEVDVIGREEAPASPDIDLTKLADRSVAHVGDEISYVIVGIVENADASDVRIIDSGLPAGAAIDAASIAITVNGETFHDAVMTLEDNSLVVSLGDLKMGDVVSVSYTARVTDPALAGTVLVNTAIATSPDIDGEREATANVSVKDAVGSTPSDGKFSQTGDVLAKRLMEGWPHLVLTLAAGLAALALTPRLIRR